MRQKWWNSAEPRRWEGKKKEGEGFDLLFSMFNVILRRNFLGRVFVKKVLVWVFICLILLWRIPLRSTFGDLLTFSVLLR